MEINGFSAYGGGMSAKISDGKYIASFNKEKLPKKFNKIIDYMRRENLKEYLDNPQIVSSSNITLIVGRLKPGVKPDEVFKKDMSYCEDLVKKSPVLAMEPNDKLTPYEGKLANRNTFGVIKIDKDVLSVKTNDPKVLALGDGKNGEVKLKNTEENKKKLLFAANPQAGRWQVEGEETMKHMATALHKFADIIPIVHYGELTPELSKKGFGNFKDHVSKSLGLKIQ
jgi:hypothetical protein